MEASPPPQSDIDSAEDDIELALDKLHRTVRDERVAKALSAVLKDSLDALGTISSGPGSGCWW